MANSDSIRAFAHLGLQDLMDLVVSEASEHTNRLARVHPAEDSNLTENKHEHSNLHGVLNLRNLKLHMSHLPKVYESVVCHPLCNTSNPNLGKFLVDCVSEAQENKHSLHSLVFNLNRSEHSEQTESRLRSWNFEVPKGMWKAQNLQNR